MILLLPSFKNYEHNADLADSTVLLLCELITCSLYLPVQYYCSFISPDIECSTEQDWKAAKQHWTVFGWYSYTTQEGSQEGPFSGPIISVGGGSFAGQPISVLFYSLLVTLFVLVSPLHILVYWYMTLAVLLHFGWTVQFVSQYHLATFSSLFLIFSCRHLFLNIPLKQFLAWKDIKVWSWRSLLYNVSLTLTQQYMCKIMELDKCQKKN